MSVNLIALIGFYIFVPLLIVVAFRKWQFVQKIGTVIMAYAVGILLSLSGYCSWGIPTNEIATMHVIQKWFMNVTVPLAIPLMLLSSDFKMWAKSLPKTIFALLGGLVSVFIAVLSGYFIFRNSGLEHFADLSAMMVGIYTGGTMNFAALGAALNIDSTLMTCMLTFEMLGTFPLLVFVVGGGFRLFRKILPYKDEEISEHRGKSNDIENYDNMLHHRIFPRMLIGVGLSIIFLGIGVGLSLLITGSLNEMVLILTVTTLAIIASFSSKIRRLPKTFEMGMILILMFSAVVASQFDFYNLNTSTFVLLYFVIFVMIVSIIFHLIICRFCKVSGDLFTVSLIGLLCSPPFIPPVVGAIGNKKVLVSGLAIGLVGYALGTYLGIGMSYLLKLL